MNKKRFFEKFSESEPDGAPQNKPGNYITKSECDWLVMSSVFVTSQSSCFFLCSREQIRQVENRL